MMWTELRKVIPSFLTRVDDPDRGGAWSAYPYNNRQVMQDLADALFGSPDEAGPPEVAAGTGPEVTLLDWDPDGEVKVIAAMLYPYSDLPEGRILRRVEQMPVEERLDVVKKYAGERLNRRHRPGRALERTG